MNDNDNQENDYHILLMNNNNIFHKNYLNVHNNNLHYKILKNHGHMDNMYDVFVLIINYYNDLIVYVDDCVDDEMIKTENDAMMNNDS